MDSKHQALLMHHKPFLARNIVWSPQLAGMMKSQGLLTEFMLQDIEACQTRDEKIRLMIDVLPLKGTSSFNKFLDVLQTSGHVFIADFLREDEANQKVFDVKDMYKQLPFVKRAFNETEKKQIEIYMAERIEAQVLKLLWKRDDREKDKALEARQKQIEQSYQYEAKMKENNDAIHKLEKDINASLEDKEELKTKLAALKAAYREMEQKHKEALDIQMKYNLANDHAAQRAGERLAAQENILRSIKAKLDTGIKLDSKKDKVHFDDDEREKEKTDMKKAQSEFFFLLEDVDLFIRKFNKLLEIRKLYENLLDERDYILIHFGYRKEEENKKSGGLNLRNDQEPSLIDAYKSFAVRNEENIMQMRQELQIYDGMLEENKAKLESLAKEKDEKSSKFALGASTWQNAIMNVMRKQLQDQKTDMRKKESLMSMQEEEMTKLRNRILELEQQLQAKDGDPNAVSADSVELIPSDTPKPPKSRNLPPLKSATFQPKPTTASPRQATVKVRPAPAAAAQSRPTFQEPTNHIINFPMGPIATPIRPEARSSKPSQMGTVLGDLRAMNKHYNRGLMVDDSRSGLRRSNTSLNK